MITFSQRKDIDLAQLLELYRHAPWAAGRATEDAQQMLAHTDLVLSAWDGDRLTLWDRPGFDKQNFP